MVYYVCELVYEKVWKVACPHVFMLEILFGSKNRERVLQFILANGEENMG